jgi:hypothetical protein
LIHPRKKRQISSPVIRSSLCQELALFGKCVDNGNVCSNLCEEHCQHFQLIFLLLLISPEYSFIGHFTQHCTHIQRVFIIMSKLTIARTMDHHDHYGKLYATRKPAFFIDTLPCTSNIHTISEDLFSKAENSAFSCCYVAEIFKCNKPTNQRNIQTVGT